MSASSSVVMVGGVTVVTHVITTSQTPPETKELRRMGMVALGTVQIIIGLMDFLFGIVMVLHVDTMAVVSGVFAWGALIFIIAGSVTVAAGKSMTRCLMDTAVAFNFLAGATSAGASAIYLVDALEFSMIRYYSYSYSNCSLPYDLMEAFMTRSRGVSSVLGCFSILEFCVSIYLTMFGCISRCQSTDQPPTIAINQSNEAAAQTVLPAYEAPPIAPPPSDNDYERVKAQEYDTAII